MLTSYVSAYGRNPFGNVSFNPSFLVSGMFFGKSTNGTAPFIEGAILGSVLARISGSRPKGICFLSARLIGDVVLHDYPALADCVWISFLIV